jgi:hypothetical protein
MKYLIVLFFFFVLNSQAQKRFVVGQITINDPDTTQVHNFKLMSGNAGLFFGITPDGILWVKEAAYDSFSTERTWNLQIAVQDDGTIKHRDGTITFSSKLSHQRIIPVTLKKINGKRKSFVPPSETIYKI